EQGAGPGGWRLHQILGRVFAPPGVTSMLMNRLLALASVLTVPAACTEHAPSFNNITDEAPPTNTSAASFLETSPPDATTTTDTPGATTTGAAATGTDAGDATTSGEGEGSSSSGGALPPPTILEVDMPGKVSLAGPVPFTVTTEHA